MVDPLIDNNIILYNPLPKISKIVFPLILSLGQSCQYLYFIWFDALWIYGAWDFLNDEHFQVQGCFSKDMIGFLALLQDK